MVQVTASRHLQNKALIPLFCHSGACEDIVSLRTTKEYGVPINTSKRNDTLCNVQGNPIQVLGTAVFYIHVKEVVRPLEVTVVELMNRDSEILLSYPTLRKMGMLPKAWPQVNKEAFKAWREENSDIEEESVEVNTVDKTEESKKDKELHEMN